MLPGTDRTMIAWMGGLITQLRRRLPEDSPLLPIIGDYGLMLRLTHLEQQHQNQWFDITGVADRALLSAKRLYPPVAGVMVTLSLKNTVPRFWRGDAEWVEALLRQLLCFSLTRTRKGLICLRLDIVPPASGQTEDAVTIRYELEDSGDMLTVARLERLLEGDTPAHPAILREGEAGESAQELTWPLIHRLVTGLKGTITGNVTAKGVKVEGEFTVDAVSNRADESTMCSVHDLAAPPLVLMVEDDPVNQLMQQRMFEKAGYRVLCVDDGMAALEWAGVLPLSLIAMDTMLPGISGPAIAARLKRMMREGIMCDTPIIALTAADTPQDHATWQQVGVSEILLKPITIAKLRDLRCHLPVLDTNFYHARDAGIEAELVESFAGRLDELVSGLTQQVHSGCAVFRQGSVADRKQIADNAHAIKSVALSLGFYHLSALVAMLEHEANSGSKHLAERLSLVCELLENAFPISG